MGDVAIRPLEGLRLARLGLEGVAVIFQHDVALRSSYSGPERYWGGLIHPTNEDLLVGTPGSSGLECDVLSILL